MSENPYLQFFLGMEAYSSKAPFGASTMVEFRKRFPTEAITTILVDFVSGMALREMEPASKMYGRLVRLSQDTVEGKDVSQDLLFVTDGIIQISFTQFSKIFEYL